MADAAGAPRVSGKLGRSAAAFSAGATLAFSRLGADGRAVINATSSVTSRDPLTANTVALFAATFRVLGLLCLLAGLAALAAALRGHERVRHTVVRTALVLPVLAVPVVIGFARATDYSNLTPVVPTELLMVYGSATAGVALARTWAVRGALD